MNSVGELIWGLLAKLLHAVAALCLCLAGDQDATDANLRELAEVKDDFLRLTIHELRRPLGLINDYLPMILDGDFGPVPEKMLPGLRMIRVGVAELKSLIDKLVAVTQLEDPAHVLHCEPTLIGQLIKDAITATIVESLAKGIEVEQQLPEPDLQVEVDRHLLRLAVINLVGNAVKYSPDKSKVRVVVQAEPELKIMVIDQGVGIKPADAKRVFDIWHRAGAPAASGLGLGLYLVRRIVELHGGRVSLESSPEKGSTFTISLPS